jgi:hypothetical protein
VNPGGGYPPNISRAYIFQVHQHVCDTHQAVEKEKSFSEGRKKRIGEDLTG